MSLEWVFCCWTKFFFLFFFFFFLFSFFLLQNVALITALGFSSGLCLDWWMPTKFSLLFFRMLPSSLPKYFTSSSQHFQNRSVFLAAPLSGVMLRRCLGQACARLSSARVGCRLQMRSGPDWSQEFDSSSLRKAPVCLLHPQAAALVFQIADDVQRNASHARLCPKAKLSWTKRGSRLFLRGQE